MNDNSKRTPEPKKQDEQAWTKEAKREQEHELQHEQAQSNVPPLPAEEKTGPDALISNPGSYGWEPVSSEAASLPNGRAVRSMRRVRKSAGNKLTAMMQVRNESGRYLRYVLDELCGFVDDIVIVDDASTDDTAALCRSCPKVVKLVSLPSPLFDKEWELRSLLWDTAVSTGPDWLLSVDADELYEERAKRAMRGLIDQDRYDWVGFRFYDMWGGLTHYREDEYWNIHRRHTATLVRYFPGFPYIYPQLNHHVPRLPVPFGTLPGLLTEFRVKHLGWAGSLEDRVRKYIRYKRIDPDGRWGSLAQYESILDLNPNLVEWKEEAK